MINPPYTKLDNSSLRSDHDEMPRAALTVRKNNNERIARLEPGEFGNAWRSGSTGTTSSDAISTRASSSSGRTFEDYGPEALETPQFNS